MIRNSRRSEVSNRAGTQQPRISEVQIVEEEYCNPARNPNAEDRLLPRVLKTPFDMMHLDEMEKMDPFCQGLRLVLNYNRPNTHLGGTNTERCPETTTLKLKVKMEIPPRDFHSILHKSFELAPLTHPTHYFQNRQITWLKAHNTADSSFSVGKQVWAANPAMFFWNHAVVYQNGAERHYHETDCHDISAIEFYDRNTTMLGQFSGNVRLFDLHQQKVYRNVVGDAFSHSGRILPVKDLVSYNYDHSRLALALYGSLLRGLDFSQKNPNCCQYSCPDADFFPSRAKLVDSTTVAIHGTQSNEILVWDLRDSAAPLHFFDFSTEIDLLDNNPNNCSQAVFSSYRTVYLCDLLTGKVQDEVSYPGMIIGMTWHNDGRISVLHSDRFSVLVLLKVNQNEKLQQVEEIRSLEPNRGTNVFAMEGCKNSTQLLTLGNLDFYDPGESTPNYAMLMF